MKIPLLSAVTLLSVLAPRAGHLAFEPVQGSSMHKSFVERTAWKAEPVRISESLPAMPLSGATERALTILDRFDSITKREIERRSRAFELARAKSTVALSDFSAHKHEFELARTTRLEEGHVVFERDAKTHELVVKYRGETGRGPELLSGLSEDTDLIALLPTDMVDRGGSWSVDAARLLDVLRPGGELTLLPSDKTPSDDWLDPAQKLAFTLLTLADNLDQLTGAAQLTWERTEHADERDLAIVSVKLEAVSRTSHGERIARMLDATTLHSKRAQYEVVFSWSLRGTGELLWDVTNSRAASLVLELTSEIGVHETWHEKANGDDKTVGDDFTLSATTELSAQFEGR